MKIRTDSRPLFLQRFVMAFQRFCLFPLPKIPFRIKFIAICTRINRKRKSLAQRRKGAKLKAESKRYNVLIWAGLNYLTISIITIFSWIFQKYLGLVLTWAIKSLTELAECTEKSKNSVIPACPVKSLWLLFNWGAPVRYTFAPFCLPSLPR